MRILPRAENVPQRWEVSPWPEKVFCYESENIFPETIQKVSSSVVSKTLEKGKVYRAKIVDIMCSFLLVLWARPLYRLEYKDILEKGEVYRVKTVTRSLKKKYYPSESSESSKELFKSSTICITTFLSMYLHSFKTHPDNSVDLSRKQN